MSTEAANAKRFKKGLTVLTPLEGELLEALELADCQCLSNCKAAGILFCKRCTAIKHAHGETE